MKLSVLDKTMRSGGRDWLSSPIDLDVPIENRRLLFDAIDADHGWQTTDGTNFYILTNELNHIESI